jgi:hypothetical protein
MGMGAPSANPMPKAVRKPFTIQPQSAPAQSQSLLQRHIGRAGVNLRLRPIFPAFLVV